MALTTMVKQTPYHYELVINYFEENEANGKTGTNHLANVVDFVIDFVVNFGVNCASHRNVL